MLRRGERPAGKGPLAHGERADGIVSKGKGLLGRGLLRNLEAAEELASGLGGCLTTDGLELSFLLIV